MVPHLDMVSHADMVYPIRLSLCDGVSPRDVESRASRCAARQELEILPTAPEATPSTSSLSSDLHDKKRLSWRASSLFGPRNATSNENKGGSRSRSRRSAGHKQRAQREVCGAWPSLLKADAMRCPCARVRR